MDEEWGGERGKGEKQGSPLDITPRIHTPPRSRGGNVLRLLGAR